MPVILSPKDLETWLDPVARLLGTFQALLRPLSDGLDRKLKAGWLWANVRNDGPELILLVGKTAAVSKLNRGRLEIYSIGWRRYPNGWAIESLG